MNPVVAAMDEEVYQYAMCKLILIERLELCAAVPDFAFPLEGGW